MFAFAICELQLGRIWLVRDRCGVKPLVATANIGAFKNPRPIPRQIYTQTRYEVSMRRSAIIIK